MMAHNARWPSLPYEEWKDTLATLHRWTQIVGKIRLAQTPWTNHSWHVTLYLTPRGLTTSAISYGSGTFQIDFDFFDHRLVIQANDGSSRTMALRPRSVADFYRTLMERLAGMNIRVKINTTPNEIEHAIPFEQDEEHAAYDPEYAYRCWCVLASSAQVFQTFRARFIGKCSPVHFFWGSYDLAVTRFSGRTAPPHPGGIPNLPDWVTREAYSHEVSSGGFWPGDEAMPFPLFYSYAYPEPEGFSAARVRPAGAYYDKTMREFILPYEDMRTTASPETTLLDFLQSTYEAAADAGKWDRAALERDPATVTPALARRA